MPFRQPLDSPIHKASKANNGWHFCEARRTLNKYTVPNMCPVPHMPDIPSTLTRCSIFRIRFCMGLQ